ncbi:MAG: DUF2892 domain-containing protein [Firmicutes bacterium]|jgi:hypothetical protein|nr:DUF2892 domain-containing protein [Bacillota bacterium]
MMANESTTDRIIRVVLGLVLGFLVYQHIGGTVGEWIFGVLGVVSLLTGITGFCAIYQLVGIRTCPLPTAPKHVG